MVCGDVNGDGVVDATDAELISRHHFYGTPLFDPWAADVNGDGKIDLDDVALLKNHILRDPKKYPLRCKKDTNWLLIAIIFIVIMVYMLR